jgi:hypothetical protein
MDENAAGGSSGVQPRDALTPDALEAYFLSIEKPFLETRTGMSERGGPFKTLVIVVFIFSLIPLLPYGLSFAASRLFGPRLLTFWSIRFALASFWFWWIASFFTSLLLLIATLKIAGPTKEERDKWLSPQQMRFAYCYGIVSEIRNYRTNHLARHIKTAAEYLETVATSLLRARIPDLADGIYPEEYWRAEIQLSEASAVRLRGLRVSRPYWYKLDPVTEDILRAFADFLPKLRDRVRDRKDIAIIESAVTDLAGYFYTEVPEISDGTDETGLQNLGMASLMSFAQKVNDLPPYRSEPQRPSPEEKVSRKVVSIGQRVSGLFNHENLLISFFTWYVLLLLLFSGGFYFALRYIPGVKVDSTVITAAVGGPIATAITAVTIPRVGKKKK